jgi:hypothetical protein
MRARRRDHVAVGVRAELSRGRGPTFKEPQREVREPRAVIGRRQQHDAAELARPLQRERAAHHDGAHAVADEMELLDSGVVVELAGLGREQSRMHLDRAAQAWIAPVEGAVTLSRQATPERLEQHRVRSVPMHEENGFVCHHGMLALARRPGNCH